MPAVTFSCPECGKVLKLAQAPPAGKKLKCPTCAAIFPLPAQEDEESDAKIQTKARAVASAQSRKDDEEKPRRKPARVADEDEDEEEDNRVRRKPGKAVAGDDDEDQPRARRRARDEDDEADEDEDDRPRGKRKAKAKRRSGGKGLLIGVLAGVVLLLLVGGGIGAYFIWFAGVNKGSGNEDPLAFVPPKTEILVGVDFNAVLSDSTLGPQMEQSMRMQVRGGEFLDNCKKETGLEFKELFAQTLIATNLDFVNNAALGMGGAGGGGMGPPGGMGGMGAPGGMRGMGPGGGMAPGGGGTSMTMILRPSRPFSQRKIVKSCKNPVRKTAHGKTYYEVSDGDIRTVYMPSDRTLILSSLAASELDSLFASDGTTSSLSPDTTALVRSVEKTPYWIAVPFEGKVHTKLEEALNDKQLAVDPVEPLIEPVRSSKGEAVYLGLEPNQLTIGVHIACADAAGATQVVQTASKSWNEAKAQAAGLGGMFALLGMPKMGKLMEELVASLKITADGTFAKITASMNRTTLAEAMDEVKSKQAAAAGGGVGGRGRMNEPPGGQGPPGGGRGGRGGRG